MIAVLTAALLLDGPARSRVALLAALLTPVAIFTTLNVIWFGHPAGALPQFEQVNLSLHNATSTWQWPLTGLAGLLFSPSRGLLVFSPIVLVVLFARPPAGRKAIVWSTLAAASVQLLSTGRTRSGGAAIPTGRDMRSTCCRRSSPPPRSAPPPSPVRLEPSVRWRSPRSPGPSWSRRPARSVIRTSNGTTIRSTWTRRTIGCGRCVTRRSRAAGRAGWRRRTSRCSTGRCGRRRLAERRARPIATFSACGGCRARRGRASIIIRSNSAWYSSAVISCRRCFSSSRSICRAARFCSSASSSSSVGARRRRRRRDRGGSTRSRRCRRRPLRGRRRRRCRRAAHARWRAGRAVCNSAARRRLAAANASQIDDAAVLVEIGRRFVQRLDEVLRETVSKRCAPNRSR